MNEPNQTKATYETKLPDQPAGFDLRTAYEILISAYIRRVEGNLTTQEEVKRE